MYHFSDLGFGGWMSSRSDFPPIQSIASDEKAMYGSSRHHPRHLKLVKSQRGHIVHCALAGDLNVPSFDDVDGNQRRHGEGDPISRDFVHQIYGFAELCCRSGMYMTISRTFFLQQVYMNDKSAENIQRDMMA